MRVEDSMEANDSAGGTNSIELTDPAHGDDPTGTYGSLEVNEIDSLGKTLVKVDDLLEVKDLVEDPNSVEVKNSPEANDLVEKPTVAPPKNSNPRLGAFL